MKTLVMRLLLTLAVIYGLGAVAYGLLHYPPEKRPGAGTILSDYTAGLGALFRRPQPLEPSGHGTVAAPDAPRGPEPEDRSPSSLDRLRGEVGLELDLSMALAGIIVPETSAHLQAAAAAEWDALRPIYDKTLPEAISDLGRLRALRAADKAAFERDRDAVRARLVPARTTLLSLTQGDLPLGAAVKLLDVLDRLDARLAAL